MCVHVFVMIAMHVSDLQAFLRSCFEFYCLFVCLFSVNLTTGRCLPGYEGNPLVPGDYCRSRDGNPSSEGLRSVR